MKKIVPKKELPSETKIANFFFDFPSGEFTFNEVCKRTGTSKTTAKRVIEHFLQNGLINRKIIGKLWLLTANRKSKSFLRSKIAHNFGLILKEDMIDAIRQQYLQAKAIILFGSYRKGDDVESSDVDIALEVAGNKEMQIIKFANIDIGYRKSVPVNLHIFSRNKIDINLFSNIANGFVLEGFLEVRP